MEIGPKSVYVKVHIYFTENFVFETRLKGSERRNLTFYTKVKIITVAIKRDQ